MSSRTPSDPFGEPSFADEDVPAGAGLDPDTEALGHMLDGIVSDHMDANRSQALRARHIVEVIHVARARPHVYTHAEGMTAVALAERAVIFDLALRLQLSETAVRDLARTARDAARFLPELWRRAEEGYASLPLVDSALSAVYRLAPPADATPEAKDAAAAGLRELDAAAAGWVLTCTPTGYRSRVSRLADRLDSRGAELRHAVAL